MGIDVYAHYEGMPQSERTAQITGFNVHAGHLGYLREAYHGEPYVTEVLMPEAFEPEDATAECRLHEGQQEAGDGEGDCACGSVHIPAATLRSRLPEALKASAIRQRKVYGEKDPRVDQAFVDFVELCERWEREGKRPLISVSA